MTEWLNNTIQRVREKSLDALEFVRKDLSEFTTTVKSDAEQILNQLAPQSTKSSSKDEPVSTSFDRFQNEKVRFQNDETTFLTDPTPSEIYEQWRNTSGFHVDTYKNEISQVLIDAPQIRAFYNRFVPACTSHQEFWSRYFFRLHQNNEEDLRRSQLLKRAQEICNDQHAIDWDQPELWTEENLSTRLSTIDKRKESDSGDSWEREFDENDLQSQTTDLSSSTTTMIPQAKDNPMKKNPDDDEWESWS